MPSLTLQTVVAASPQQVAAVLGDETIILGLDEGAYFGVRAVGMRIWELLQSPVRLSDVADRLCEEFEVDRPRCEQDLLAFVEALHRRRLVVVQAGG